MKSYRVVKAAKHQMAEVARVFKASFRDIYPNFADLHTPEEDQNYFTNTVFEKNSIYVAEDLDSGKFIGFIAFNHEFIDHLYILPGQQRKGLGSDLIQIALKEPRTLRLWTFQQNSAARAFYKRHGFVEIKETDGAETEESSLTFYLSGNRRRS